MFTVGHSTRGWAEFVELLKAWEIQEVVDVRKVPGSRAFPWFNEQRLERALPNSAIAYVHLAALGGFRRPATASVNSGWQNARFRAYADYMQTEEFENGLRELNERRKERRVCVMCSEAVWWRCHRRMIADAEVARGIPVKHMMSPSLATRHELTEFAVVTKAGNRGVAPVVTYPGAMAAAAARRIRKR